MTSPWVNDRRWRQLWASDKVNSGLRVAIALLAVVVPCELADRQEWLISLLLGVIASAMTDSDDHPLGRLKALLVTLLCFAVAAFSVRLLFAWPPLFIVGLTLSTFAFVMLGAIGERYATIAQASLLLAIYTMLSLDHHAGAGDSWYLQPLLLLVGSGGYGLWSLLWSLLFSLRPAQQVVARVYLALASFLERKAELFEPDDGLDRSERRLALVEENRRLVAALDRARNVLRARLRGDSPGPRYRRYLTWYFLAQDVHERASSAHYPYEALASAFARSDLLFRAQRLLRRQANSCRAIAAAIAQGQLPSPGHSNQAALDQLAAALSFVEQQPQPMWQPLAESVADLCRNLVTIDRQLTNAANPDALEAADAALRDTDAHSLGAMWQRLKGQLNRQSGRFRHGIRLALALASGYALIQAVELPHGYWVLLTTVFVCQPGYSDTWRRFGQRMGGTVIGVVITWLLLALIQLPLAQMALAVVAGISFFLHRSERYLLATASMTVMMLICFHQIGDGYTLLWPRLMDTLIGGGLGALAVALILPDWQQRRLPQVMARTLTASSTYLQQILSQYRSGKRDDLPYRVARRDAHNADGELSAVLTAMLGEPDRHRQLADAAFRFLCLSHTLLGYVSALGAHRERIDEWLVQPLITEAEQAIERQLAELASQLASNSLQPLAACDGDLKRALEAIPAGVTGAERRLLRQLALIHGLLPELLLLADTVATGGRPLPGTAAADA